MSLIPGLPHSEAAPFREDKLEKGLSDRKGAFCIALKHWRSDESKCRVGCPMLNCLT